MKRTPWQIQRAVIFALVVRELQTRFGGRMIGLFWVILEPLLHITVILLMRAVLRQRFSGVMLDTVVYLTVAMIPFFMFRNIWFRVMDGARANTGLFAYRQVKPFDAFIARPIIEFCLYAMVFVVMMAGFGWYGYEYLPVRPLEYLGVVLLFMITGFGLGLISAVLTRELPAAAIAIRLISFPLYVLSGVIIRIDNLPPEIQPYLLYNPMLHLVELSRWAYFPSYRPMWAINLEYPLAFAFVVTFLGVTMYRLRRRELLSRA
jgi:capsular polysaccharide transport system permease protein